MLIALRARGTGAPRWSEQLAAPARWALTGLFPAVLVALDVVPAVALGGAVPARTLAGIHLAFLCGGSTPAAPYVGYWLRWRWPCRRAVTRRRYRRPARSGGIVSHLFMAARDATLRRLKTSGTADAVLPVVAKTDFPRSYVFHADIRSDAGFWINRWTARYYGLAAVRATDGTTKADR